MADREGSRERKRVLLVDDEEDLVQTLKKELEGRGYEVLSASDGITALETARREEPHLIVLDLMLPSLDGFRVLKFLKADQRFKEIPILVLTARADPEDLTLALECGANGCLVKPVKLESLSNQIVTLLGDGG